MNLAFNKEPLKSKEVIFLTIYKVYIFSLWKKGMVRLESLCFLSYIYIEQKNIKSTALNFQITIQKKHQPIPCLGLGLSAGGFWKGRVTGTSVTSYLTLKCPSDAYS